METIKNTLTGIVILSLGFLAFYIPIMIARHYFGEMWGLVFLIPLAILWAAELGKAYRER